MTTVLTNLTPESAKSPRVSARRRSSSLNNENAAPASGPRVKPPMNRFGFKKRSTPVIAVSTDPQASPRAVSAATPEPKPEPVILPKLELSAHVTDALGDLDAPSGLLRVKISAGQFEFKAKIAELTDLVKQLKSALAEQLRGGKRLVETLGQVESELSGRMQSLADETAGRRHEASQLRAELASARQRAEERGRRVHELRGTVATLQDSTTALQEESARERARAEAAEGKLAVAEAELDRSAARAAEQDAKIAALEEASAIAAQEMEALKAAREEETVEAAAKLQAHVEAAEQREAQLTSELKTEATQLRELSSRLEAATAAQAELSEAHSKLTQEHRSLSEASASQRTQLELEQAQLAEKSSLLTQKDADLRNSIQTLTTLQRDHNEQLQHERGRAQALDDEVRTLRTRELELQGALQTGRHELERAQAELTQSNNELRDAQANLQISTAERERLAIETAERFDSLVTRQAECASLEAKLSESQEALAAARASLEMKTEQATALEQSKHELDVEYRSYQEHHGSSNQQQMQAISELKLTVDRLSVQVETKQDQVQQQQGSMAQQMEYLKALEAKLRDAETKRRDLHNTIQELKGNIRVFCRVRPPSEGEIPAIDYSDSSKLSLGHSGETYNFGFDRVFSPAVTQEQVFDEVDGLVQSALDGFKVCIFAYGQTGSGKTFTMQGAKDPQTWGLIPRALSKILSESSAMRNQGWEWNIHASFLEIYNESLRDLLHSGGAAPSYAIKHEDAWGTVVANASKHDVSSMEQINSLMVRAAKQRAVGTTEMNAQSSRSHSVFALYLKGTNAELNSELCGALHLVDLAGSERLDKSGATGAALKETQAINKSLSSLADVFTSKATGASHVPFRNSKLTHLMEPCLSGHGKTLMLVNVAPEQSNSHETLCSLRFAKQVSQCDTGGGKQPKRHAKPASGPAGSKAAATRPMSAAASSSAKRPK